MAKILKLQPNSDRPQTTLIGERLVASGDITADQLRIALFEQQNRGGMLGQTLTRLGFMTEVRLAAILAGLAGAELLDLRRMVPDPESVQRLPVAFMQRHQIIPLMLTRSILSVALTDPYNVLATDALRRWYPEAADLHVFIATEGQIQSLLHELTLPESHLHDAAALLEGSESVRHGTVEQHPVVRFVDALMIDAAQRGASDIHLEPAENGVEVRYRCDGVLRDVLQIHRAHWQPVLHRIKIMAGMDIADTRSIKDGRFHTHYCGMRFDCRVATMPTTHGENVVIRILDPRRLAMSFTELGFSDDVQRDMRRLMAKRSGITLVVGPTGSGKTTTLYALLRQLSDHALNIMTLEEPVEYDEPAFRQTSIDEEKGFGFAEGVRGLLRQDPDVIMIGEIRDADTAQMAIRAAMTGHKVLSALHCHDALAVLPRLYDLGIKPSLLAEQLNGVIAQRLVQKTCHVCQGQDRHCRTCGGTAVHGRCAITEVMTVDAGLREKIADCATRAEIEASCRSTGFIPMSEDARRKAGAGIISAQILATFLDESREV